MSDDDEPERHRLESLAPLIAIALEANREETEYLLRRLGFLENDGSEPALWSFSRAMME
jgi:hypothetical protein